MPKHTHIRNSEETWRTWNRDSA